MYFEEAEVKEYFRKDSKGNKKPYYQIGIKKKSKFFKPTNVALVDVAELKELISLAEPEVIAELEAKLNAVEEEKLQLKQELQQVKQQEEELTSEVENLRSEKQQLQQDLLKAEGKSEEIIQLQQEHKEEIAELNFKLNNEKDLTKTLLVVRSDLLNRNFFNRIINKEPESSKKVAELKKLPEDVEANISKE